MPRVVETARSTVGARYAALGVLAGAPQSIGVVADLGGASLELKRVNEDGPGVGVSLPVGPFSMGNLNDASPDRLRKKLRSLIEPIAVQIAHIHPHREAT